MKRRQRPPLTEEQILAWADAHYARTGQWPSATSDRIRGTSENWAAINIALNNGRRGLPGGVTLARLLRARRGASRVGVVLTEEQVLAWADAHYARTGKWPISTSGRIPGTNENWTAINGALYAGCRGLPGGVSLALLLRARRGANQEGGLLTEKQILAWADVHYARTGKWPTAASGAIPDSAGENWNAINSALKAGCRGLPGGKTLLQLLTECRGLCRHGRLTEELILKWADAHHRRTGHWPHHRSGAVPEAPGDSWAKIDSCLREGLRGLRVGHSLSSLLAQRRGVLNRWRLLTEEQILGWADAHYARTGHWPSLRSGAIKGSRGESWKVINSALRSGHRGLPGGSSLGRLLAERRGARAPRNLPLLSEEQILAWADAHHARTGHWPTRKSGRILEAPGEQWRAVSQALRAGCRGLSGGLSLARLLAQRRGVQNRRNRPPLSVAQILAWADEHHQRTGGWPTQRSGPVLTAPGEVWGSLQSALWAGLRGLPGGSSLARLLAAERQRRQRRG